MVLQLEPLAKKVVDLLEPHIERLGFELVNVNEVAETELVYLNPKMS